MNHPDSTEPAPARPPHRSLAARITLVILGAFTAWHIFASFLWISPPSELRALVPGNLLTQYMIPWYGQSWSVFAPEPINGDYHFQVRAIIEDGEDSEGNTKFTATEWINASSVELSMSRYNLFPPRAASLSVSQASKMLNQWKELTPEQQQTVALGYYEGDNWLGRMQEALTAQGSNDATVVNYIVQERHSVAYATQVAQAMWGEDRVTQVQFKVSRQNVVPFAERHNPDAERPAPVIADTGWRGLITMPGQSADNFRDVFRPLAERNAQ